MARVISSTNDAEYMAANRINSELAQCGTSIYGIVNLATMPVIGELASNLTIKVIHPVQLFPLVKREDKPDAPWFVKAYH